MLRDFVFVRPPSPDDSQLRVISTHRPAKMGRMSPTLADSHPKSTSFDQLGPTSVKVWSNFDRSRPNLVNIKQTLASIELDVPTGGQAWSTSANFGQELADTGQSKRVRPMNCQRCSEQGLRVPRCAQKCSDTSRDFVLMRFRVGLEGSGRVTCSPTILLAVLLVPRGFSRSEMYRRTCSRLVCRSEVHLVFLPKMMAKGLVLVPLPAARFKEIGSQGQGLLPKLTFGDIPHPPRQCFHSLDPSKRAATLPHGVPLTT